MNHLNSFPQSWWAHKPFRRKLARRESVPVVVVERAGLWMTKNPPSNFFSSFDVPEDEESIAVSPLVVIGLSESFWATFTFRFTTKKSRNNVSIQQMNSKI